jgi:hypothetical protein
MRIKVDTRAPGIVRRAKRYETKLREALALSVKHAARRDRDLLSVLGSASVEGVDRVLKTKTSTISFRGKPLRGSLHQMYAWEDLDHFSAREISQNIYSSLHQSIRDEPRFRIRA